MGGSTFAGRLRWPTLRPWIGPIAIYLVSLGLRLSLWQIPMYGDEAVLYYFSRHPLQDASNLHILGTSEPYVAAYFFWWRPLFRLFLVPVALLGFDAYRLGFILVAAALAPVTFLALRAYNVRAVLAYAAAAFVAVGPVFVQWGAIAFPDTPMALAFTIGLWARARDRLGAAAVAFTASILLKEVAIVPVAAMLVVSLGHDVVARRAGVWPLRMGRESTGLCLSSILGLAPLWLYMGRGGKTPGWTVGGNGWSLLDQILPAIWLLPVIFLGLAWARTRLLSGLTLVLVAFYVYYSAFLGRGVELWYLVHPHLLAVLASAVIFDELVRRVPARRTRIAWAGAAMVALLLGAQAMLPASSATKEAIFAPAAGTTLDGTPGTLRRELSRPGHMEELAANLRPTDWESVLLLDFGWFFLFYPFGEQAKTAYYAYTDWNFHEGWARAIEEETRATIVGIREPVRPLNQAIRNVYADCIDFSNGEYVLIHGQECPGRSDQLAQEYERLRDGA